MIAGTVSWEVSTKTVRRGLHIVSLSRNGMALDVYRSARRSDAAAVAVFLFGLPGSALHPIYTVTGIAVISRGAS